MPPDFTVKLCQTREEIDQAMAIRFKVFVDEQGYAPSVEIDEKDPDCDHFLAFPNDDPTKPIGTIRFYPPTAKLGRLAVLKEGRGTGAGRVLVQEMERHVRQGQHGKAGQWQREHADELERAGNKVTILCYSQQEVERFYTKLGYETVGEPFLEEGQPHVKMVKTVQLSRP